MKKVYFFMSFFALLLLLLLFSFKFYKSEKEKVCVAISILLPFLSIIGRAYFLSYGLGLIYSFLMITSNIFRKSNKISIFE